MFGDDPALGREILARLIRVERKLDLLLAAQGVAVEPAPEPPPAAPAASIAAVAEILALLRRGQKDRAIQRYRKDTGVEREAAEVAVGAMEQEHLRRG